jgi:hypothetical protein
VIGVSGKRTSVRGAGAKGLIVASLSVGRLDEADQHGDVVAAIEAGYGRLLVGSWFGLTAIGHYGLWQDGRFRNGRSSYIDDNMWKVYSTIERSECHVRPRSPETHGPGCSLFEMQAIRAP